MREHIVGRAAAGDFFERAARLLQIREHEFLRTSAVGRAPRRRARVSASCARSTSAMWRTLVIAGRSAQRARRRAQRDDCAPQRVEALRRSAPTRADRPSRRPRGRQIGLVRDDQVLCRIRRLRRSSRSARSQRLRSDRRRRASQSATRARLRATARRLPLRRRRRVSRRPAVSTSVTRRPSRSTISVTRSRVVPGTSVTIARDAPTSALNRLDLPTFGWPTIATCSPSRTSRPRARVGEQRVDRAQQCRRSRRRAAPGSTK